MIGDIRAQVAASHASANRLIAIMDEAELDTSNLWALATRSSYGRKTSMRRAIRKLPEGTFKARDDHDWGGGPSKPRHHVPQRHIRDGGIHLDYGGTSAQIPRAVNVTLNMTRLIFRLPAEMPAGSRTCPTMPAAWRR